MCKVNIFCFHFRRVLKNREVEVIVPKPYLNHPLSVIEQKKKDSIHSIENAIGMYPHIVKIKAYHLSLLSDPQAEEF